MKSLFYAIFLFAFLLPLSTNLSNIFLFVSIGLSIYYIFTKKTLGLWEINRYKLFYSTAPLFLLLFFGLFFTNQIENCLKFFERSVSFILIPVLWLFIEDEDLLKIKKHLFKGLLFGSMVSILLLIILNFYRYYTDNGFNIGSDLLGYYYTSKHFTKPIDIHPTYLGLYYLTSTLYLGKIMDNIKIRISIIFLLCLGLLFLNSRIIFFCFLLIIFWVIFLESKRLILENKFKKLFLGLLIIFVVSLVGITIISKTYIGTRLKNIYEFEMSTNKEENFNSFNKGNSRIVRWISIIRAIKKKPIFGYGLADEYEVLRSQFEKDGLLKAAKSRYNAHNQYLGYAIRFGVVGVMVLIIFFVKNIKLSIKMKDYHYLILLLIIVITNFVENYLDRNAGITFFTIFFTINAYTLEFIDFKKE